MHNHLSLFPLNSKKITFRERERKRERKERGGWGVGGGGGQEGRREFAKDVYQEKSYHTHPIMATCSFGDYSTTGC